MYDPLHECYSVTYCALYKQTASVIEAFEQGVYAAEMTSKDTVSRASKYPNAEAHAVGIWLRACLEALKLKWEDNRHENL